MQTQRKTTSIASLSSDIDVEFQTFLTDKRKKYSMKVTMVDSVTLKNILDYDVQCTLSCFWCRHKFDTVPIGCPIRHVPASIKKTLTSVTTNEKYIIKENVPESTCENITSNQVFETDGVFCSFSCCIAFINSNVHDSKYRMSKTLLNSLYYLIHDLDDISKVPIIKPSPSWRLLKDYGGPLTIDEFRNSLSKIDYTESGIIKNIPRCRAISTMFTEQKHL
jgi:hypothetical protein